MGFNIFEKDTKMKYEIITLLSQAKGPISLEKIKKELSEHLSYSTIKDYCHTLDKLIDNIYSNDEVHLVLTKQTVHLEKKSSNLQFLFEALLKTDVNAQIINTLIRKRKFKTDDFCFYHGISMSTLRRKNQLLNKLLESFNLHITTSDRLTILNGSDFDIYIFSFLSYFFVYHDTTRIAKASRAFEPTIDTSRKASQYFLEHRSN
ncbi:helix-turn-helix domain-containing protein [Enterococcus hermanniensis]|nr:helix-turn-helix domain-containing protein [Enterococcus hermanniensis]